MSTLDIIRQKAEESLASAKTEERDYVTELETTVFQHKVLVAAAAVLGAVLGWAIGHYL